MRPYYKTPDRTTGIFKPSPKLSGNIKFVISKNDTFMAKLSGGPSQGGSMQADTSKTIGENIKKFKGSVKDEGFFYTKHESVQLPSVLDDLGGQYDTTYQWGCRQAHGTGRLRFFAPLWLKKNDLPKYFAVFAMPIIEMGDNKFSANRIKDIIKNGRAVYFINLHDHAMGRMLLDHVGSGMFVDDPLTINNDIVEWHGISLGTGSMAKKHFLTKPAFQSEGTVTEGNSFISTGWAERGLVCANMANLEFLFDSDLPPGIYDYTGVYFDLEDTFVVRPKEITAQIRNNFSAPHDTNFIINGGNIYRPGPNIKNDRLGMDRIVHQFDASVVKKVFKRGIRAAAAKIDRNIGKGQYVAIEENGAEIAKAVCGDADVESVFARGGDMDTSYGRLALKLRDGLKKSRGMHYAVTYTAHDRTLKITCATGSNMPVRIKMPVFFKPLSYNINNKRPAPGDQNLAIIDMPGSFDVSYCYSVPSALINTEIIEKVLRSGFCLIKGAGPAQYNNVVDIVDAGHEHILIFGKKLPAGARADARPSLFFGSTDGAIAGRCAFRDISCFATGYAHPGLYDHSESDTALWLGYMIENIQKDAHIDDKDTAIVSVRSYVASSPYTKPSYINQLSLAKNTMTYGDSPYKRLEEDDLQEYARLSIINPFILNWADTSGTDGTGNLLLANFNIAYGINNFMPAADKTKNDEISGLRYSWFLLNGDIPPYFGDIDYRYALGHTSGRLSKEDIEGMPPEKLRGMFLHKYKNAQTYEHTVDVTTKIKSRADSGHAYALFRGVEYELEKKLAGKNFAAVLVDAPDPQAAPQTSLVERGDAGLALLLVEYAIPDSIAINFNRPDGARGYFLDRHVLYKNTLPEGAAWRAGGVFEDLSFSRMAGIINATPGVSVINPGRIIITPDTIVSPGPLSHSIRSKNGDYGMLINRKPSDCGPVLATVLQSMAYGGKPRNGLDESGHIKNYGIFKVGDMNTLLYDNSSNLLAHPRIGETATDFIDFDPFKSSLSDNFYRYYTYRNNKKNIAGTESPLPFPSILSTVMHIKGLTATVTETTDANGMIKIDIRGVMESRIARSPGYKNLAKGALKKTVDYLLKTTTPRFVYKINGAAAETVYNKRNSYKDGELLEKFKQAGAAVAVNIFWG